MCYSPHHVLFVEGGAEGSREYWSTAHLIGSSCQTKLVFNGHSEKGGMGGEDPAADQAGIGGTPRSDGGESGTGNAGSIKDGAGGAHEATAGSDGTGNRTNVDGVATTIPFGNANAVDWVLRPYTYYVNSSENLIWVTRETPLLGVKNGAFVGLANPISQYTRTIISNLNPDGTLLETDNCEGWSGVDETFSTHIGFPPLSDAGFLDYTVVACGYLVAFYCVEQ